MTYREPPLLSPDISRMPTAEVYRKLISACEALAIIDANLKQDDLVKSQRKELTESREQFHSDMVLYATEYSQRPLEGGV